MMGDDEETGGRVRKLGGHKSVTLGAGALVIALSGLGFSAGPATAQPPGSPGRATSAGAAVAGLVAASGAPALQCASAPGALVPGRRLAPRATVGSVRATVKAMVGSLGGLTVMKGSNITIRGPGASRLSEPVAPPQHNRYVTWESLTGGPEAKTMRPLCVVAFPGNDNPTVLMGFFTGGAHCCTIVRAYSESDGNWSPTDESIGDPEVDVSQVDGTPVIVTADDSFSYEFTDYASSGDPVKILTVRHGRFTDVTTHYRAVIRADAARWWTAFRRSPRDDLGFLAAWAADSCEIGRSAAVSSTLSSLERSHKLGPTSKNADGFWASGADFVSTLTAFLAKNGYCRT